MSDPYELPFDEESGKFKAQTIIAEVLRTGFEASCEIESADFEFPDDVLQMDTEFEAGATEVRTEVSLKDEVYEAGDFLSIVAETYEVELRVVPREYDAGGQASLAAPIIDTCSVKCGGIPLTGILRIPQEDQLPIPAVGEEETELVIRITMGSGGRPWQGVDVKWERIEGGCAVHGELESITDITDEEGEIKLSYTAPKLYYKPGAEFFEIFQLFTETGGERRDVFRLKIPLAPYLVFQLKAEKSVELEGTPYGIQGELTSVVEIDPHDRVKIIEGEARLKTSAEGEEKDFPVACADFTLLLGDEDGVDEEQQGLKLKTNAEGKFRWEIPELVEAYGQLGRSYALSDEKSEMPELVLTENTEKEVDFFESRFNVSAFPADVFQGDVGARLRKYRIIHAEQLASQEAQAYERVRSGMEMLGIGVRYVVPFYRGFSEQFAPLLGVLGDTFWDFFNYIWNLKDLAGKIFAALGRGAKMVAETIVKRTGVSPGYLRTLLGKFKPISWAMSKMAGFVEWLGTKISAMGDFVASFAPGLRKFAESLAQDNQKIHLLLKEITSKGAKAAGNLIILVRGLVMGLIDGLAFLFKGVSGLLQRFATWLLSHVAVGMKMAQESFQTFTEKYCTIPAIQKGFETLKKALENSGLNLSEAMDGIGVQAGNYLQSLVETFFGKGYWTGSAQDSAVSSFASMKLFNPAASLAVDQLYQRCVNLEVASDTKAKRDSTVAMASGMRDLQLTYEKSFIFMEAVKMFVDSMKIPVQVGLAIIVTFTTLGAGGPGIAVLCTKMELAISTIAIVVLDVPHAIAIFLGAFLIQQSYLSAVAHLET